MQPAQYKQSRLSLIFSRMQRRQHCCGSPEPAHGEARGKEGEESLLLYAGLNISGEQNGDQLLP